MSLRPILRWPDPLLSKVCAPVDQMTPGVMELAQDMLDTMYHAQGRGLAAPQVGVLSRIFVMDIGWKDGAPEPLICINPVITPAGYKTTTFAEGCLSIPGVTADVTRPAQVQMVWTDPEGVQQTDVFDGFGAVCVQHEADHLDGVVTFDHLDADTRADLVAAYHAQ